MGITHLESLALTDLAGVGTRDIAVDSTGLIVVGGSAGIPVPLQLGDGDGDFLNYKPPGRLLLIYEGTQAAPLTALGPAMESIQISAQDSRDQTGYCENPVASDCFSPVHIMTYNKPAAHQMATALTAESYSDVQQIAGPYDGHADALAAAFIARKGMTGATSGGGACGIYSEGGRLLQGSPLDISVLGAEFRVLNYTDVDCLLEGNGACYGIHISLQTGNPDVGTGGMGGAAINVIGAGSRGWEVGLLIQNGAIVNAAYADGFGILDRSSGSSVGYRLEGVHLHGIDLRGALFGGRALYLGNTGVVGWNDDAESDTALVLEGNASTSVVRIIQGGSDVLFDVQGYLKSSKLQTSGSASPGMKVVCVDQSTGQLYASSTAVDCST